MVLSGDRAQRRAAEPCFKRGIRVGDLCDYRNCLLSAHYTGEKIYRDRQGGGNVPAA